jgi:O-antigen ligase
MGYFLFQLVTATLFIRPAEIFPSVYGWPIYECLILTCLAVSLPGVLRQLSPQSLTDNPITACVIGLWAAVVMSHLAHFNIYDARMSGFMFFKLVVYYLLLVANVDSEQRVKGFLRLLMLLIAASAVLALLSAHHIYELPGVEFFAQRQEDQATGDVTVIPRLQSSGIFNDPNDFAMILVTGVVIACSFVGDRSASIFRVLGLGLVGLFCYAIYSTQSRGGLLALLAALGTLACHRWGWRRTVLIAAVFVPVLFVAVKGRMTQVDDAMDEGTGQSRIQLWAEGIALFKQQPLFGIGQGTYAEEVGQVAHNSFVHAFTEMGVFGGSLFLGAFGAAFAILYRSNRDEALADDDGEWKRLFPYVLAMLIGFAASMFSLSRNYSVPVYLALGLATAFQQMIAGKVKTPPLRFNSWFLQRMAAGSVCFLAFMYVFVRVAVRWS